MDDLEIQFSLDPHLPQMPVNILAALSDEIRFRQCIANLMRSWLEKVFPEFIWNWAWSLYVQDILEKVTRRELKRVILSIPPRHGKSELVSIKYPIYRLSLDPKIRIIIAGYNADIATKFTKKAQDLVTRNTDTGIKLHPRKNVVDDWETVQGGSVRAVGVGSGLTGHGGNLIIIDDAIKRRQEAESETYRKSVWQWYTSDLYTRVEPGGATVIVYDQMARG